MGYLKIKLRIDIATKSQNLYRLFEDKIIGLLL